MLPSRKKAVLIGIDHYQDQPLPGCCNDARTIGALLYRHEDGGINYFPEFLTSDEGEVTIESVRGKLVDVSTLRLEELIIYFSGHACNTGGVFYLRTMQGGIIPFSEIMEIVLKSKIPKITLLLDCCLSGGIGDIAILNHELALLRSGISVLASSHSEAFSLQSQGRGLFTEMIIGALHGGAADLLGQIYLSDIFSYISRLVPMFNHHPVLKSYSKSLTMIRRVEPKVSWSVIRSLGQYFMNTNEFLLSPAYEKSSDPRNAEKEMVLESLRMCRDAGLIVPEGAKSLFEAAMRSKRVTLTPLGGYYRNLVRSGTV